MTINPRNIGFGVDNQYSGSYEGGLAGVFSRFRNRLSHVSVVSLNSCDEAENFRSQVAISLPVIHHLSNVAPGDLSGPHLGRLAELERVSDTLEAVWCCEDVGIWSLGPYEIPYFAPPLFDEDVAEMVGERISILQAASKYRFLPETPTCSFVAGRISLGDFFCRLVEKSGCDIVLDVGHVYSFALYTNQDPRDVLWSLPLDAVREVHIAGGKIAKNHSWRFIDTHIDPISTEVAALFRDSIANCKNLRAITLELGAGLRDPAIDAYLCQVEEIVSNTSFVPALAA